MNGKVFILHNEYANPGGEDVCVQNEIAALRDSGVNVIDGRVPAEGLVANVAKAVQAPWSFGLEGALEKRLRDEKPDILHVHNLFPSFSPKIFQAARRAGIRTVCTLHNYRPLCLNGLFLTPSHEICERCAGGNYWHGVWRGCYRESIPQSAGMAAHLATARSQGWYDQVDQFIAPAEFLRDKFVSHGFPAERIHVQGHFMPALPSEDPVAPEPYILYLGRLSDEKGIRWLLKIFENPAVSLKLLIAGKGPLEAAVKKVAGVSITYLGYINGEAKMRAIRRATALVLPSECYENFPLTVMEANAWGVPALVAKLGGMAEMVKSGENGSAFTLHDPLSFWSTLEKMTQSQASLDARKRCQTYARKHFSKEAFLNGRKALYRPLGII